MLLNFDLVKERLENYSVFPDRKFRIESGLPSAEKDVEQKSRQYWADNSISNEAKLAGFEYDLSDFDPENTSNREMRDICWKLCELGIVDTWTASWMSSVNVEFNSLGNEINMGGKTNLFASFDSSLEYYKSEISAGKTYLKNVQTSLATAIYVVLALQERSKMSKEGALVDTKV